MNGDPLYQEIFRRAERERQHQTRMAGMRDKLAPIDDEAVPLSALTLVNDMYGKRQLRFGFPTLDKIAPLFVTTLSVVAARTGMGKTTLARQVAITNARAGAKVLYASLEYRRERMTEEFYQEVMRIPKSALHREAANKTLAFRQAERDMGIFGATLMLWHPPRGARLRDIFERVERDNPDLLIIDYARAISGWKRDTAEALTHELANFTRERPLHTMLLQQLSREGAEGRPSITHLGDSDVLGQRADQVFLLWRPMQNAGIGVTDSIMEVVIGKNRFGPVNVRRHMHWTGSVQGIDGFTQEEEDAVPECCREKPGRPKRRAVATLAPTPVAVTPKAAEEPWPTEHPGEEYIGTQDEYPSEPTPIDFFGGSPYA